MGIKIPKKQSITVSSVGKEREKVETKRGGEVRDGIDGAGTGTLGGT